MEKDLIAIIEGIRFVRSSDEQNVSIGCRETGTVILPFEKLEKKFTEREKEVESSQIKIGGESI